MQKLLNINLNKKGSFLQINKSLSILTREDLTPHGLEPNLISLSLIPNPSSI